VLRETPRGVEVKHARRVFWRILKSMRITSKDSKVHCGYCKKLFMVRELTADHVVPLSRGGTNARANIAIACFACNQEKDNRTAKEWARDKKSGFRPLR
jgi:5-methylcytosine-specific restriction endonuclease McrA